MANKKKLNDNFKIPVFSFETTKITLDNIKEFFESKTLFIVISEGVIVNQFCTRDIFIKNKSFNFYHSFGGNLVCKNVKIYTDELQEYYDDSVSDMKVLIKDYIKKDILYGTKI